MFPNSDVTVDRFTGRNGGAIKTRLQPTPPGNSGRGSAEPLSGYRRYRHRFVWYRLVSNGYFSTVLPLMVVLLIYIYIYIYVYIYILYIYI